MSGREAWGRAAECAALAAQTSDENRRILLLKLRDSWIRLANEWEMGGFSDQVPPDFQSSASASK
jgi:hypothetical protein